MPTFTPVGTATGTNSCTVPAHLAGDIIVINAYRSSTTAASIPVGYVTAIKQTGTTSSIIVGYRIATSTSDTSGTWTNATALVCQVYRPASGYVAGIGATAGNHATTNTVNYPAITLADTSGNSWVTGWVGCSNTSQTIATAPTGMTNQSHETAASTQAAGHDTAGGVSSWSSTNVTTTGTAGDTCSAVVELMLLPKVATSGNISNVHQLVSMEGLWQGQAITCQNLFIPLPNPSGLGNCYALCCSFPNGTTLTITDSNGNTWPGTATLHANAGSGNMDSAIYILPNIAAGQNTIKIAFGTAPSSFQYEIYEFYGLATSSVNNGTSDTVSGSAPNLACGSFTPTNNNANGGNLILTYYGKAVQGNSDATFVSRFYQMGGFTPIEQDYAQLAVGNCPHASGLFLQATAAAIDPKATAIGDTDPWNSLAIALALSPGAGTAPQTGIRLNKLISQCGNSQPATASYAFAAPAMGNLRVLSNPDPNITFATIKVTDNEGNTYTPDGVTAGFFYLANATQNDNLIIYVQDYGGDSISSWFLFDISGAATSPFNSAGTVVTNQSLATSWTISPAPAPSSAPGIAIMSMGLGTGPNLTNTSPTGVLPDYPSYTGKTDQDTMNNADSQAHFYFSATGSETWSGTCNTATTADLGGIISFIAAPAGATPSWFPLTSEPQAPDTWVNTMA